MTSPVKVDLPKVSKELVNKMLTAVPVLDENSPVFDWTQKFDPTEVEQQFLAKALFDKAQRDKEKELTKRVAAFRVLFIRRYKRGTITDDMTPRTAEIAFKKSLGRKTLEREANTLRQEDIDILTKEWYDLYSIYYLGGQK